MSTPDPTHRVRAFADLSQLSDAEFFASLAEGLVAIHENASRLAHGMETLKAAGNARAANVLEMLVNEEAGKYLILLDAVRCPRDSPQLSRQLRRAGDHLAKGIYAEACTWRSMEFAYVADAVERARPSHYLDGPSGYDWIFRNPIEAQREEVFYVDYVADSDGYHAWWSPDRFDTVGVTFIRAYAFQVVDALHLAGFSAQSALAHVARVWRPVSIDESLQWNRVRQLNDETLVAIGAVDGRHTRLVAERWPYPMYSFEMKAIEVKQSELRSVQSSAPVEGW